MAKHLERLAVMMVATSGCGSDGHDDQPPKLSDDRVPIPASTNTSVALFFRPFQGVYPTFNFFDHDRPAGPGVDSGGVLTHMAR